MTDEIATQKASADQQREDVRRSLDNAIAERAATAIRSAFFVSVSGDGKPYLRLTYPTIDAMHDAEDAIKAFAGHLRFRSLSDRRAALAAQGIKLGGEG